MLLSDEEIETRLDSPDNLINQLKNRLSGSHLSPLVTPEEIEKVIDINVPAVTDLIDDAADKIKIGLVKTTALDVLSDTLIHLKARVAETDKPEKLSKIAGDMGKVLNSITPKNDSDRPNTNVIIYKPIMVNESYYDSIQVNE